MNEKFLKLVMNFRNEIENAKDLKTIKIVNQCIKNSLLLSVVSNTQRGLLLDVYKNGIATAVMFQVVEISKSKHAI